MKACKLLTAEAGPVAPAEVEVARSMLGENPREMGGDGDSRAEKNSPMLSLEESKKGFRPFPGAVPKPTQPGGEGEAKAAFVGTSPFVCECAASSLAVLRRLGRLVLDG